MVLDEEYLEQLLNKVEPIVGIEPPKKEEEISIEGMSQTEEEDDVILEPEDVEVVTEDAISMPEVAESMPTPAEAGSEPESEATVEPEVESIPDDLEEAVLSPEEIDAMLNAAQATPATPAKEVSVEEDLLSMLEASGDDGLEDIGQLLRADEEGEAVDLAAFESAMTLEDVVSENEADAEPKKETREEKKARKAAKKAEKKAKKEAARKAKKGETTETTETEGAGDKPPKRQGFFGKVLTLLTETDEEEETEEATVSKNVSLSEENKEILEELDKEGGKKKKLRKDKKNKKNKKKSGDENPDTENDDDEEAAASKDKKAKKAKKPKKEKKPKVKTVDENEKPAKKVPKKRVISIFAFCLSVAALILVLIYGVTTLTNLHSARLAFDNQEYETTYVNLFGEDLGKDDREIFDKRETILKMSRKLDSYENYMKLGMKKEAVNALFEGVRQYPELRKRAMALGVNIDADYQNILSILAEYGIDEAEAVEIAGNDSRVWYTKRVESIANGTEFTYDKEIALESGLEMQSEADAETDKSEDNQVMDILPEEYDILPEDPNTLFESTGDE